VCRSSTRGLRPELVIRFALYAGGRLPKVVLDEVQNLYREDLSEVNENLVSKYRQLLANRAPQLPQLDLTQECEAYRTHVVSVVKEKLRGIVPTVSETFA
jgi:hypothetical protein